MSVVQLLVIAPSAGRDGARRRRPAHDRPGLVADDLHGAGRGALALLAQTWAQAHLSPTRTAIVMSMEPVFAALFAVTLGSEGVTAPDGARWPDGARRHAAWSSSAPRRRVEGEVQHLTVRRCGHDCVTPVRTRIPAPLRGVRAVSFARWSW